MSTYFYILTFSISIPLLFSFHPKIQFYKNWKPFMASTLLVCSVFIWWDIQFTEQGVWGFNKTHLHGAKLLTLPLEEVLFFFFIPYCCTFTYEAVLRWTTRPSKLTSLVQLSIATIALFLASLYHNQSYTFTVLSLLGISCVLTHKNEWLSPFYKSFLLLLIPFYIVDGLLTGNWIQEEVVWYNESDIWGLRLGSIPLEDVFYFLLLFLTHTAVYEYFKYYQNKPQPPLVNIKTFPKQSSKD